MQGFLNSTQQRTTGELTNTRFLLASHLLPFCSGSLKALEGICWAPTYPSWLGAFLHDAVVTSESHLDRHHRRTLDANIVVSGLLGKVWG